jgi:hypothetical protein
MDAFGVVVALASLEAGSEEQERSRIALNSAIGVKDFIMSSRAWGGQR